MGTGGAAEDPGIQAGEEVIELADTQAKIYKESCYIIANQKGLKRPRISEDEEMKLVNLLLLITLILYLFPEALAIEAGAIAVPSMPVPNMDMPKPNITKPITEATSKAENQNNSLNLSNDESSNIDKSELQERDEEASKIAGKWKIKFEEMKGTSLDLTLWSMSGGQVMGFGTLKTSGADTSMTASGSFSNEELVLAVKSAQAGLGSEDYKQCDLDLYAANETLIGTYILSLGADPSFSGNATATKS